MASYGQTRITCTYVQTCTYGMYVYDGYTLRKFIQAITVRNAYMLNTGNDTHLRGLWIYAETFIMAGIFSCRKEEKATPTPYSHAKDLSTIISKQTQRAPAPGRPLHCTTTSSEPLDLQSGFTSIFTFFTTSAFGSVTSSIPFRRRAFTFSGITSTGSFTLL